jgi:hypothetical protein
MTLKGTWNKGFRISGLNKITVCEIFYLDLDDGMSYSPC